MDYKNTHRDIIDACKRGNQQAQFNLYRLYSKAMYNICLRMMKNELDAEDMLQNSFIDVFRKLDSFKFQSSIGAWIKRIVINNCINSLKKKRLLVQSLEDHPVERNNFVSEVEEIPVGLSVELVNQSLHLLPDGYRVVFSLYMLEGYDHQEIAEILGVSVATSKSQYSRAKKKLRELLIKEISP